MTLNSWDPFLAFTPTTYTGTPTLFTGCNPFLGLMLVTSTFWGGMIQIQIPPPATKNRQHGGTLAAHKVIQEKGYQSREPTHPGN